MISFYPGPSRVYDEVPRYVKAAHKKGILSLNHRSEEFMKLYEKTVALMQEKLHVPSDYKVFFLSSATECWEVIAQSLSHESHHIFNGAFGEKWFDYTKKINSAATAHMFDREELLDTSKYNFTSGDLIAVTQNETSNGTQVAVTRIAELAQRHPHHLIAVDATSSMAGIELDFSTADIWFASVQKCFGLPAGLAIMVCSPRAIARALELNETNHYNSFTTLNAMAEKWQTSCTPNVLAVYLLMRVLKDQDPIEIVSNKIIQRFQAWSKLLEVNLALQPLIRNEAARSYTVLAVEMKGGDLGKLKAQAKKSGFLLGEGYGNLKGNTFRIANFPALRRKEIQKLMRFFLGRG